jgi:hypothetical protein
MMLPRSHASARKTSAPLQRCVPVSRCRELDTPLLLEWPNGRRDVLAFRLEEDTQLNRFSIHPLAHHCLDPAELPD